MTIYKGKVADMRAFLNQLVSKYGNMTIKEVSNVCEQSRRAC